MKYKIKIITYNNNSQWFDVYVKKWFGWCSICNEYINSRDKALRKIDEYYDNKVKSIEFEYINKK